MPTVFHCIGRNSMERDSGVGFGDQLYNHAIFEEGLVQGKTASVLWLSTGQQRPRLDLGAIIVRLEIFGWL